MRTAKQEAAVVEEREVMGLKAKLGLDVFKENKNFHIHVVPGKEEDPIWEKVILVCPAGLYSKGENGGVDICVDGCLECGTCRIAAGIDRLSWVYPEGGAGVQYRFG